MAISTAHSQSSSEYHEAESAPRTISKEGAKKKNLDDNASEIVTHLRKTEVTEANKESNIKPPNNSQSVIEKISKVLSATYQTPPNDSPEIQAKPYAPKDISETSLQESSKDHEDENQIPSHGDRDELKAQTTDDIYKAPELDIKNIPEIVELKAIINYKGFSKPVTTCRAQIVNTTQDTKGSLFELEENLHISNFLI